MENFVETVTKSLPVVGTVVSAAENTVNMLLNPTSSPPPQVATAQERTQAQAVPEPSPVTVAMPNATYTTSSDVSFGQRNPGGGDVALSNAAAVNTGALNQLKFVEVQQFILRNNTNPFTSIASFALPKSYYSNKEFPQYGNARFFSMVRSGFVAQLQVNVAPGSSGLYLLAWCPPTQKDLSKLDYRAVGNFPSVLMDISRMTTATLDIPYISDTNYVKIDSDDQGYILVVPIAPYNAGPQTDTEILATMFVAAREGELQCPTPYREGFVQPQTYPIINIQNPPGTINLATYETALNAPSLALAGEGHLVDTQTPGGYEPIADVVNLARIPSLVTNDTTDYHYFDWQDTTDKDVIIGKFNFKLSSVPNLAILSNCYAFFRGSIVFHVIASASTMHRGRLRVCFRPNSDQEYTAAQSMAVYYSLLDISQSNCCTLAVPFNSETWMRSTDDVLGRVQIFVNNQLAANKTAANHVYVYVTASLGPDAAFYCPRSGKIEFTEQSNFESFLAPPAPEFPVNALPEKKDLFGSSHTLVKHLFGRFTYLGYYTPDSAGWKKVPLDIPKRGLMNLLRAFCYWSGELVICITNNDDAPVEISHTYFDQPDDLVDMSAHGSVLVPGKSSAVTAVPFYSLTPVRSLSKENPFGFLYIGVLGISRKVVVHAAFRNLRLYLYSGFPILDYSKLQSGVFVPVPNIVPPRDLLCDGDVESNPGPLYVCLKSPTCNPFGCVLNKYLKFAQNYVQDHVCACFLPKIIVESRTLLAPTPICFYCNLSPLLRDYVESNILSHKPCDRHTYEGLNEEPPVKRLRLSPEQQGLVDVFYRMFSATYHEKVLRDHKNYIIRSCLNMLALTLSSEKAVSAVIAASIVYDTATVVPPAELKYLITLLVSQTYEAFKSALDFIFGRMPSAVYSVARRVFSARPTQQGFTSVTSALRACEWWIKTIAKFVNWIKTTCFANPLVGEARDQICELLAAAEQLVLDVVDLRVPREIIEVRRTTILDKLSYAKKLSATVPELDALVNKAVIALRKVPATYVTPNTPRVEPLGVWLRGVPGSGKSILMCKLARDISIIKNSSVFYHPTGSNFFSGYHGQYVHCIDDLGQNKDEKDIALICQCISSSHFTVPMANLEDKAMQYSSRLVIATTNMSSFRTYTLTTPAALERRFPIVCDVQPKYSKSNGMLDLSFNPHDCWIIKCAGQELEYSEFLQLVLDHLARREKLYLDMCNQKNELDDLEIDDDFKAKISLSYVTPFDDLVQVKCPYERERVSFYKTYLKDVRNATPSHAATLVIGMLSGISLFAVATHAFNVLRSYLASDQEDDKSGPGPDCVRIPESAYEGSAQRKSARHIAKTVLKESAYDGQIKRVSAREIARKALPAEQGPSDVGAFAHLLKFCAYVETPSGPVFGVILGGRKMYFNTHYGPVILDKDVVVHTPHKTFHTRLSKVSSNYDSMIVALDIPELLPSISKYVSSSVPTNALLLYFTGKGFYSQDVTQVSYLPCLEVREGMHGASFAYTTRTQKGMCGGLLVGKVDGTFKALGFHAAGSLERGFANAFNTVPPLCAVPDFPDSVNLSGLFSNDVEGVVIGEHAAPTLNRTIRTKFRPTALQEKIVPELEPAVLHSSDPRLNVQIEGDFLDYLCKKWKVNVHVSRPDVLEAVVNEYIAELKCEQFDPVTLNEAINSSESPLNFNGTAGAKYPGMTRRQLLQPLNPTVKDDVVKLAEDVGRGAASVVFETFMKDELRPRDKISQGKTRIVESCPLDFLLLYRMVMLKAMVWWYNSDPVETGVAPGMNVYTDFGPMVKRFKKYRYCLDFSAYDSTLSDEILAAGVEVLACCSTVPSYVRKLHAPIILSHHWHNNVVDLVLGGMPSGAPCTSVLNSIVNVLMARYLCALMDIDNPVMVAYGDDNVLTFDHEIDMNKMVELYQTEFGVKATNYDKTPVPRPMANPVFLKRQLRFNPDLQIQFPVLPLGEMIDRMCWTRGPEHLSDQTFSFALELAGYGKEAYNHVKQEFFPFIVLPHYSLMESTLRSVCGLNPECSFLANYDFGYDSRKKKTTGCWSWW
ncbi:polyprotein [aquamavirus A2]|uniref:Genome polyprotein n=1 Tax=Bear picornavirus 1 TaxID=2500545 RepID=A0A3S5HUR1_9PICO|nr:polyprotein [aquamavirus A2]